MRIVVKSHEELEREERTAELGERAANAKYVVRLTEEERADLEEVTRRGRVAATTVKHAWILLKADEGPSGPAWPDRQIRDAYGVSWSTIARVRQKFVEEGLDVALVRKKAVRPPTRKVDGEMEARLIALTCSAAPEGEARWTLRLLASKMVELEYVDALSHETVRRVLKKTNSSRGRRKSG
jgi:transposase